MNELGVSQNCAAALDASLSGRNRPVSTGDARAALARANAARQTLEDAAFARDGVDWTMLAAIGLVETGFRPIAEVGGGPGRGVFQINVPANATEENANDLEWAANWTASGIQEALQRFSTGPNAPEWNVALVAALSAHNAGVRGIQNRIDSLLRRGIDPSEILESDVAGTTTLRNGHRTGMLYRQAMECFQ